MNHRMDRSSRSNEIEMKPVPYASLKSFSAGAISGAIAKTVVAPFDRFVTNVTIFSASKV